ncbi:hypothetical protein FVA74_05010 [Salinibacterium sp. dk2585]|uniref:hypothetical protein n=1 Tax=unclassified Salinibacterium TaxID=2632331 RepID=UPI0011C246E4|nr:MULTISPECIES: hypothetical protein [unclassified Salinibacterium]QEE61003.1 hypothetical protein FVA74_05010 [Salinibacterium sp. dk2585]TXK52945.1 hypothetical protein FVP63_11130 [Salinibacterium sp. dk5596]
MLGACLTDGVRRRDMGKAPDISHRPTSGYLAASEAVAALWSFANAQASAVVDPVGIGSVGLDNLANYASQELWLSIITRSFPDPPWCGGRCTW